jgi:hypothetical protein
LRLHSTKRSASGVSVRSLTVINPTGTGGDKILTGRALMRICWPPKRITKRGQNQSSVPFRSRACKGEATPSKLLLMGFQGRFRITSSCSDRARLSDCANTKALPSTPRASGFAALPNGSRSYSRRESAIQGTWRSCLFAGGRDQCARCGFRSDQRIGASP